MSISSKIESLITAANSVTGESRTDLTACVQDLKDGYGGGFPKGLTKCEYIENTATCAIKTDIIPESGDILRVDFQLNSVTNNPTFAGCANAEGGSTNRFLIGHQPSNEGYHYQGADKTWRNTSVVADTNRHTIEFDSSGKILLDGTEIATFTPNWGAVNYPLGIFCKYYGTWTSASGSYMNGKLYGVELERNGSLVMDMIPSYVNLIPNGDIGLFDQIGGRFYINNRSGTFTKGADVN